MEIDHKEDLIPLGSRSLPEYPNGVGAYCIFLYDTGVVDVARSRLRTSRG